VGSPLSVPPELDRAARDQTREEWLESGRLAVALLSRTLGTNDLSGVQLLDVGCGTKLVKALLDNSMPIGRYVGIDVSAESIEWLKANVCDPRFEFHHARAHAVRPR
jgi:ubiquinone/menaquinone biosynthesis C-methylase UbiE